jgi:type II secretory pathway component PulC
MPAALGILSLIWAGSLFAASEIVYDSGNRRDPFVPLTEEENVSAAAISSAFKLEGVIYDPSGRSMAILNGKSYQTGDLAGNAKVVKILKDHVVISLDGEEKTLWIRVEEKT